MAHPVLIGYRGILRFGESKLHGFCVCRARVTAVVSKAKVGVEEAEPGLFAFRYGGLLHDRWRSELRLFYDPEQLLCVELKSIIGAIESSRDPVNIFEVPTSLLFLLFPGNSAIFLKLDQRVGFGSFSAVMPIVN